MDFDWLKKLAPTVASALMGPLAGVAIGALSDAMGVDKGKVQDILSTGSLTGDQLAQVKIAEIELKKHELDNGFKFAELEFRDRDSARQREMAIKDRTNSILAYTVVGAFIAVVAGTLAGYAKVESVLAGTLIGYLSAKAEQVLAYYFGSSRGSKDKDSAFANALTKR